MRKTGTEGKEGTGRRERRKRGEVMFTVYQRRGEIPPLRKELHITTTAERLVRLERWSSKTGWMGDVVLYKRRSKK